MLSWDEIVKDYIIKYSPRIQRVTQTLHDHFGIQYFTYHRIDQKGKYTVLVDRPDWAEHFVANELYLQDPFLRHPTVYQPGICCMGCHGSEQYRSELIESAKKVLKSDTSVVLIEKSKNDVEFFGFAADRQKSSLEALYLNHMKLLKSFADHFKSEMKDILIKMEKEANTLAVLKGQDFFCDDPIATDIDPSLVRDYLQDLGSVKSQMAAKLTQRERECLYWLPRHKTAKETAALLGLSRRTVEFYFENIKDKLSCWSKQELISIAKEFEDLGLL